MARCPMCGQVVGQRYPIPPEVVTKETLDLLSDTETLADLRLCSECIHRLMDGESTADVLVSDNRTPKTTESQ